VGTGLCSQFKQAWPASASQCLQSLLDFCWILPTTELVQRWRCVAVVRHKEQRISPGFTNFGCLLPVMNRIIAVKDKFSLLINLP